MSTQIQFDDKHKLIMIHSRPEEMMAEWAKIFTETFEREYPSYRVVHVPYGEPVKDDLRDQLAMAALTGYITHFGVIGGQAPNDEDFARWSYDLADAMLKARGE